MTINPDTTGEVDYTVDPADNSGTITVIDDDSLPEISIVANNGSVAENEGPAIFSLTTTDLSADETLDINATPDENGEDFLTNTVASRAQDFSVDFTDPDGDSTYTGTIEIELDNDTTGEATGDIKLTLNADPSAGKTYQLGSTTEGTINIYDDDAPTLKIRASSPNFVEGSNATADFIVSTEASPNKPVEIQYDVTETQSFVDSADKGMGKTTSLDFSNNAKQATISVDIAEDSDTEVNGTITVTLKTHSTNTNTYMVATSPNDAATTNIKDDDTLPVISIKADSGEAVEGPLAVPFKLTATGITGQQRILVIKATPSEVSDNFLRAQDENVLAQSQVTFTDPDGDGTYEANYTQRLHNDRIGEVSGDIKLTLNENPGVYTLGSTTEGVLTILDDDIPGLKITGKPVTEGDNVNANFDVSAVVSPNRMITVNYELTKTGDFIDENYIGDDKSVELDFSGGVKKATIPIPIISDTKTETNGSITITLRPDDLDPFTYTVRPSPDDSATLNIIDDDTLPVVAIEADSGGVAEDMGPANFKLTATGLSGDTTLSINATPAEVSTADFLSNQVEATAADFDVDFSDPDNDDIYTGELSVAIDDDQVREAHR